MRCIEAYARAKTGSEVREQALANVRITRIGPKRPSAPLVGDSAKRPAHESRGRRRSHGGPRRYSKRNGTGAMGPVGTNWPFLQCRQRIDSGSLESGSLGSSTVMLDCKT